MSSTARVIGTMLAALIIIATGAAIAWAMGQATNKLPLKQYYSTAYSNAVWDWTSPLNRDQRSLQELGDFMYMHQLNAIYVDISTYQNVLNNQDGVARTSDRKLLEESIDRMVSTLDKRGVKVYAAAGDIAWSNRDKQYIPIGILEFAQQYNASHPQTKLAGVQFDIESYNQEGFPEGSSTVKSLVLTDYLSMVDALVAANQNFIKTTSQSFELGFAIPYWFDNENGNIPPVAWNGKNGPMLYHLMDRLNELPNSNVVVMAYRNAARGNDGVISHSRTEIDYAKAKAPNVKVMIGQEVNEVEPAKITYFGQTQAELSSQFSYVADEFGPTGVLGGIAINDLAGYQSMAPGQ